MGCLVRWCDDGGGGVGGDVAGSRSRHVNDYTRIGGPLAHIMAYESPVIGSHATATSIWSNVHGNFSIGPRVCNPIA